jgi:Cu2+-exporting ATPase
VAAPALRAGDAAARDGARCAHCGAEIAGESAAGAFCCKGCEAAYSIVRGLGLEAYYRRRSLDPDQRPLKPEAEAAPPDFAAFAVPEADGTFTAHLMVDGLHCAACVWLIESVLGRQGEVVRARINMTTRRLALSWKGEPAAVSRLAGLVTRLGYRLVPYDPARLETGSATRERELLRALAVAGFAAGNVMLLSISVWAGAVEGMGPATRDLLHWFSALIALPAVVYAGWPFYRSAFAALRAGRVNMDVPISLAVVLSAAISVHATMTGAQHAYFDASVTLLFFLLIGRYLDSRARGRARSTAERLVSLAAGSATIEEPGGRQRLVPPSHVRPGMVALTAPGERIAVDGRVREGRSEVDASLITGESVPSPVGPGDPVFAGTLNLSGLLRIEVQGSADRTLLAEIVRLMEAAEQGRAKHAALAERVARVYAPAVHGLALFTFLGWLFVMGAPWQTALVNAVAVLIVTCPCALALAIPVVQVVASGRLMRRGILLKSATALERLAEVDTIVLDKTGTLTEGRPEPFEADLADRDALAAAAALAGASRHPLARALRSHMPAVATPAGIEEVPGRGLRLRGPEGEIRLGSRDFAGGPAAGRGADPVGPELWLSRPGRPPARFRFTDRPRPDAAEVAARLRAKGYGLEILSGDRAEAVRPVAEEVGIEAWRAPCPPAAKTARLNELASKGRRVLMVGDGLNDAPALATAHVSMSPATAADISQTTADVVFQGAKLGPVADALGVARAALRLVRQNLVLALVYNGATVPLAMMGYLTPLIAAVAMSSSSLIVTANALRLNRRRPWT